MKRNLFNSLFFILTFLFLSCSKKTIDNSKKINIVCTTFPQYDWTRSLIDSQNRQIILTLIEKNGIDLHHFEPTESDIAQITSADLFIYNGGKSDEWIKNILSNSTKQIKTINLMNILGNGAKLNKENEYDEHIWLSLRNAKLFTKEIAKALIEIDPENEQTYSKKCENYLDELELLDQQFMYASENASLRTFIFSDRFPFRYFLDDYNLNFFAPFDDCSTQMEVSSESIKFLADKVNELGIKYIYSIETSEEKTGKSIISNAHNYDCETIRIDSMQTTTLRSAISGKTYIKTMQKNLQEFEKGMVFSKIDIDMTKMSSTMIYAEVFNMLIMPEEYTNKQIKVKGKFQVFESDNNKLYYAIIIPDATNCCQQGIEFIWQGKHSYPADYPKIGQEITISGTFNCIENEMGQTYTYLEVFDLQY